MHTNRIDQLLFFKRQLLYLCRYRTNLSTPEIEKLVLSPSETKRLIYSFFVPVQIRIGAEKGFYPVKVGATYYDRNRFSNIKTEWNRNRKLLKLPTDGELNLYCKKKERGDSWADTITPLHLDTNNLLFIEDGVENDEITVRLSLAKQFNGIPLSSVTIKSIMSSVLNNPNPACNLTGPTEFIALRIDQVRTIKRAFIEQRTSILATNVYIVQPGQQDIPVRDTKLLDIEEEAVNNNNNNNGLDDGRSESAYQ
eukprot:TRINITY_DN958_c0_g1_i9.p1 TRINITY_DN958_c0_g1~~TRINITY_DN958_c0_g1_i9.p1  ORF type:complete len:253 (-),score=6.03 TRINITY_DN958_c0_g1_i9:1221-1979(-)